jgi:hypothetical protein
MSAFPISSHSTGKIINDTKIVPCGIYMTIQPDTGVFWKGHKILSCEIYFILHGKLTMVATVTGNITAYVEFYFNGVLQGTVTAPGPFDWAFEMGGRPFLKTSFTITAKGSNGDSVSKEIVIFRLFW